MFAALAACLLTVPAPDLGAALATIRAVGPEGAGNAEAAKAWKVVVGAGPSALVPTLGAFKGANPAALNWLRAAAGAVAEEKSLDAAKLLEFVADASQHPAARRLAYELAEGADKPAALRTLAGCLNDPDPELRHDAIALRLAGAKTAAELRPLFDAARDSEQTKELAKRLGALGEVADLTVHDNLVTQWHVVGPFDSPEKSGFGKAFAPETTAFDPTMMVEGRDGVKVGWKPAQAVTPDGIINVNLTLTQQKNAVAYLAATLSAPAELSCELRLQTPNAVKLFVNGTEVFARPTYHGGSSRDQYVVPVTLKMGPNAVLVKLTQDDQPHAWTKEWSLAARATDSTGGRVALKQLWPGAGGASETVELGKLAPAPKD